MNSMSSCFKNNISLSIFGESHQKTMGIIIEGIPAGVTIDFDFINQELTRRRPFNDLSTKRIEKDAYEIVSGYFNNKTTGSPLCILVTNENFDSSVYQTDLIRPSHVDYVIYKKYHGFFDYRGSGHFSGRLTVLFVIAGAIFKQLLMAKNIYIAAHISQIQELKDDDFSNLEQVDQLKSLSKQSFPVINPHIKEQMMQRIQDTAKKHDSIGGIVQTMIYNLPVGVGEPLFDSLESQLSKFMFSIPGIKGISFGSGFDFALHTGSEINDSWKIENEKMITKTNHNGGINGGMSNGMPIIFQCVVRPTPSIGLTQETVNLQTHKNTTITIQGKHDPAIISRIAVIIEAMTAIAIYDLLLETKKRS